MSTGGLQGGKGNLFPSKISTGGVVGRPCAMLTVDIGEFDRGCGQLPIMNVGIVEYGQCPVKDNHDQMKAEVEDVA